MKVLILGGGGQVARALLTAAPADAAVTVKSRAQLDIAERAAVWSCMAALRPDWVLNAAAYTAVDLAEDEPDRAQRINAEAPGILAEAAAAHGSRLLHLSTDFVFDGLASRPYLPTDPTNPLSVYGTTKRDGELRAREHGDAVILRTAWVYAAEGRNFLLTMLRLMRERPQLSVVADQIGTPTPASSIARAIWRLVGLNAAGGIHHWTDLGVASWYDFAVAIGDEAVARGLIPKAVPVIPIKTAAYPTRARRPAFSVLDTDGTRALLGIESDHWRHSLRKVLDELRTS